MELTKEQIKFLDEVVSGTWKLNSNGEVDVKGWVGMQGMNLTEIPVKFGSVWGDFNCSMNQLISLKNSPTSVGGNFYCYFNNLTSLEGSPSSVGGGWFDCSRNNLTNKTNLTNYFKNTKEEDFPHWGKLNWNFVLQEYPFLINIGKKYLSKDFKYYLDKYPQTKIYYED